MGTTTPFSWPYPEPTAPVRDGAVAIKNVAQGIATSLNNRGLTQRILPGTSVVTTNAAGQATITYTGFSAAPVVLAVNGDSGSQIYLEIIQPIAVGGFNFQVRNTVTNAPVPSAAIRVNWLAIGATASA